MHTTSLSVIGKSFYKFIFCRFQWLLIILRLSTQKPCQTTSNLQWWNWAPGPHKTLDKQPSILWEQFVASMVCVFFIVYTNSSFELRYIELQQGLLQCAYQRHLALASQATWTHCWIVGHISDYGNSRGSRGSSRVGEGKGKGRKTEESGRTMELFFFRHYEVLWWLGLCFLFIASVYVSLV